MPILKTKMSKSAWVLIALLIVAIIALPILHFVGIINLSFLGDGFLNALIWASTSILNGILLIGGVFVFGALCYYTVKKYLIGTQIPATTIGYNPQPSTPSQPQSAKEETVISQ